MRHLPGDQRRCVLIIDDDPVFTLLAGETLQQAGFRAPVAHNLGTALALFESERPDLVLLDVELPDASGFDICARIRATPGETDIPIIMVTGNNDTESIARAYEVGATDFINKPVLWPTLPHRVEFILRARDNMRALRLSEHKNRALLQALPDAIYIVDGDGVILGHITGAEQRSGDGIVGMRIESIVPVDVAQSVRLSMKTAAGSADLTTHEFEIGGDGDRRAFEARLRPQADGTFLVILRDATERRRAEAQIEYLAYYDTLTGLPNRQLFVRDVGRAISVAQRAGHVIALLYVDLDRFKRINDNLGHSVGDALLRSVARRLERSVRGSDVVAARAERNQGATSGHVARLGGDEFVILLTDIADNAHVARVADRIQQLLGEPFDCDGHRFVVTPSIGIAMYPQDGHEIDDLLVKADMAMYQAKDQGRNGHAFYGESMAVRSLGRLELEIDMRRAFDANEFQLYYQPKMDLATGTIIGVEALLRWHDAERGWISPDKFIPVAEETGMIVAIGDWVIRETCKQIKAWASTDLEHLSIAVNVSVQQFAREDFVDSVLRTMWQHGIKPHQLELEITESLLMRNVDGTTAALKRLGAAGLTLSIDDFGTGYSSLGYLRQFPVDALKIDRSFVKDLPASTDAAAICAAIIAMARELKLKVIAEGVETGKQLEFLRTHRCDQAQGYLISEPVCCADLERLLRGAAATRHGARPMGAHCD
ncbi:MAG: EAL domain-containing protein [Steroidobacteraceae bacterium]|jgi:diguanylate cyclase (GGDEF)-like protein/PAS domain S-box-containing protein